VVFDVDPSLNRYDATSTPLLYERMIQRIEAVPGVRSATMSRIPLLVGSGWTDRVATEGGIEMPSAFLQAVRSNFFETMEIPLVAGRSFGPEDTSPVTVINQALARKLFPDVNPVGSHLRTARGQLRQVVGVVRDSKYSRLRGEGPPTMFLPYNQIPPSGMTFEIRTAIEPGPLIPSIRNAVREIDSRLPLFNVTTQDTRLRESLSMERMIASFAGVFGIGGLLLACIGLYGIVSYGVTQRTGEIGIRMALGARRSDVTRMVVRETIAVTLIGIVLGLGLALGISGLIANLLYGVTPRDPATIVTVVVLMLMVSMFAAYLPARRASLIDPLSALRHE
jgi:predicted permease